MARVVLYICTVPRGRCRTARNILGCRGTDCPPAIFRPIAARSRRARFANAHTCATWRAVGISSINAFGDSGKMFLWTPRFPN